MRLTANSEEERAPSWSPDGRRVVYCCRKGDPEREGGVRTFEICVMNADGTGEKQVTSQPGLSGFPNWGEVRGPSK